MSDSLTHILSQPHKPYALLYRPAVSMDSVEILHLTCGKTHSLDKALSADSHHGKLLVVPFCQVAKRGYHAINDETPILTMPITARQSLPLSEVISRLPDLPISVTNTNFNLDDIQFGQRISQLIEHEIGQGAGSNFVLHRKLRTSLVDYHPEQLLSLFRRLLQTESSAYWCFLINTGDEAFIGVSPELHASLDNGEMCMNPISGTLRYPEQGETIEALLEFLTNQKETNELYMVVDEELKVMSRLCERGAQVSDLRLKQLSQVIHTEYVLKGKTKASIADILTETLPAPTIVGSPVQNACQVIARYEPEGRRYYSGVVALVDGTHDNPRLDSAICIRTAEVTADGKVEIGVGATIVRDSVPLDEAEETRSKAQSLYAALTQDSLPAKKKVTPASLKKLKLGDNPKVRPLLNERNNRISKFWLSDPEKRHNRIYSFADKKILILDGNDAFTAMFKTLFSSLGALAHVEKICSGIDLQGWDLVVAGPGPGNPLDVNDFRVNAMREAIIKMRATGQPFFAVCLSHQLLCLQLGLPVARLSPPNQGVQKEILLDRNLETAGFYNTFCASINAVTHSQMRQRGIEVYSDPDNGNVHALRAHSFSSVQFHLESVLTLNGQALLERFVAPLFQKNYSGMAS